MRAKALHIFAVIHLIASPFFYRNFLIVNALFNLKRLSQHQSIISSAKQKDY